MTSRSEIVPGSVQFLTINTERFPALSCTGSLLCFNLSFSLVKEAIGARSSRAPSDSSPREEKSLALVTIQSVGLIAVSLAAVTVFLYLLAGPSFVHLGPRSYPARSSVFESGVSRTGASVAGTDGDAAGIAGAETAPRLIGGGTKEAFQFEGFPDVTRYRP